MEIGNADYYINHFKVSRERLNQLSDLCTVATDMIDSKCFVGNENMTDAACMLAAESLRWLRHGDRQVFFVCLSPLPALWKLKKTIAATFFYSVNGVVFSTITVIRQIESNW